VSQSADKVLWAAVVPAAGSGLRMKGEEPKQFLSLGRRPVLIHTLQTLVACPRLAGLVVVAPEDAVAEVVKMIGAYGVGKVQAVVAGGPTRQDSVRLGVAALDESFDYLIIHDGVRPLVDQETIERVMDAAREFGAATAGLPAQDTLAEVDRRRNVVSLPERSKVWQIQTPQGFWRPILLEAQSLAEDEGFQGTDEAGLVVRLGKKVRIVEGSPLNIKITTPQDLRLARALLNWPEEAR